MSIPKILLCVAFFLSQHVTGSSYIIRAAWIDQKYRVNYHAAYQFTEDGSLETLFSNTSFNAKNDFKSIGLRFGADGSWQFCRCWSLVGEASTSFLYGKFHIKEVINGNLILDVGAGPQLIPEILTLKENFQQPRFNIEGLLGLQYGRYFTAWKTCLAAAIFYEVNFWFNQNQIINRIVSVDSSPINEAANNANIIESIEHQQGNLQLSGFSLRLHLDKCF